MAFYCEVICFFFDLLTHVFYLILLPLHTCICISTSVSVCALLSMCFAYDPTERGKISIFEFSPKGAFINYVSNFGGGGSKNGYFCLLLLLFLLMGGGGLKRAKNLFT